MQRNRGKQLAEQKAKEEEARKKEEEKQIKLDSPQTILFIGDSMLEGLAPRLASYAKENGHKLYSVIWYSSTSEIWGETDSLKVNIDRYGPPNWKPDTGINELVAKNVKKGCFFLSDGMKFDRAKDGAHPTRNSAIQWMDSVIRWMPKNSAYPITNMKIPVEPTARATKQTMYQPKR